MPRPDSKIMGQTLGEAIAARGGKAPSAKNSGPVEGPIVTGSVNNDGTASNVTPLRSDPEPGAVPAKPAKPLRGKAAIEAMSKAEKKQKITELKAAHKLGREPLDAVEAQLKLHDKGVKDQERAHEKAVKEFEKTQKANAKERDAMEKKRAKYAEQYAKAEEKFAAEIDKFA